LSPGVVVAGRGARTAFQLPVPQARPPVGTSMDTGTAWRWSRCPRPASISHDASGWSGVGRRESQAPRRFSEVLVVGAGRGVQHGGVSSMAADDQARAAGVMHAPIVVSMRTVPVRQVAAAVHVTSRHPAMPGPGPSDGSSRRPAAEPGLQPSTDRRPSPAVAPSTWARRRTTGLDPPYRPQGQDVVVTGPSSTTRPDRLPAR
jgi:hypothetical protein